MGKVVKLSIIVSVSQHVQCVSWVVSANSIIIIQNLLYSSSVSVGSKFHYQETKCLAFDWLTTRKTITVCDLSTSAMEP